jgi:hypothetical protein
MLSVLAHEFRILRGGATNAAPIKPFRGGLVVHFPQPKFCDSLGDITSASKGPICSRVRALESNTVDLSGVNSPCFGSMPLLRSMSRSCTIPGNADKRPGPHGPRLFSILRDNAFRQKRELAYPGKYNSARLNEDWPYLDSLNSQR